MSTHGFDGELPGCTHPYILSRIDSGISYVVLE